MNSEAELSRKVHILVGLFVVTAAYAATLLAIKYFLP
jgi:hypothetical protein